MEPGMATEPVRELDTKLAALRAAAKSLREQRPSWFEHIFHPGRYTRRHEDFSAAVAKAFEEISRSIQNATAQLSEKEREISELKKEIAHGREKQEQFARESNSTIQNLTDRAAEMREQFAEQLGRVEQQAREHCAKIEQLAAEVGGVHENLGNEFRERIKHLLDEQRVAIRQLSLKTSEDAILSDRARRATELKIEELAKRLPRPA
jgi:chromosome segregation ATPase